MQSINKTLFVNSTSWLVVGHKFKKLINLKILSKLKLPFSKVIKFVKLKRVAILVPRFSKYRLVKETSSNILVKLSTI